MKRTRWEDAKRIIAEALARPPAEREAYLQSACEGDEELHSEVRELLRAHRDDDGFLEPPTVNKKSWQGRKLAHRYRLEERIGQGSFGEVYTAWDELSETRVAVKLYHEDARFIRRLFRHETATLHWLRLPGVVQILDEGTEENRAFIVMEMIEGRPFPGRDAPTTWDEIRDTTLALVESVGRLHWAGVFHCDLKPTNVLVRPDGTPVILDLGVSAGPSVTGVGALGSEVAGTPRYVAPERFRGARPSPGTDLFSIGVILYEALARPGTEGFALVEDRTRWHCPTQWPSMHEASPGLPVHVANAIDQLRSADPSNRPAGAEPLRRLLSGNEARQDPLDRVGWLGSSRPIEAMQAAAREGRSVTLGGPVGSGRSRALGEVERWLASDGRTVLSTVPSQAPFASLRTAAPDGVPDDAQATIGDVASHFEAKLREQLRKGAVLLVDDLEELDQWSRRVIDACRQDGCVLATRLDEPCDLRLQPRSPEDLTTIFAGPDRLHHLRADAARELWRRSGGWPGRMGRELEAWVRAGLARHEGNSIVIRRTSLERLRAGLFVGGAEGRTAMGDLDPDLEELLVWIDTAGGEATRAMLGATLEMPRWQLDANLEALLERHAIEESPRGGLMALWSTHRGQSWPEVRCREMHARLAERATPGTPARFRHLLAAHRFDELGHEALLLADKQLDRGHAASAESTLIEGMRWSFLGGEPNHTERFLLPLLEASMTTATSASLNRLLHYCQRLDPERPRVRAVESIAQAALCSYRNDAERALEMMREPFEDALLERFRHAVRIHAASGLAVERHQQVVQEAVAWAEEMSDGAVSQASAAEWRGWLDYRLGDYPSAVRHHARAAELAPTRARRAKSYTDAAWAALEQGDFIEAESLAGRASQTAASCRHAHYEARAESVRRMVAYRTLQVSGPDLELVEATRRLGTSFIEGIVCLTEAAVAWRADQKDLACDLARSAAVALRDGGAPLGESLALGLATLCGHSAPASLLEVARGSSLPGIQVQLYGLLARAGWELSRQDREAAQAAADRLPTEQRDTRREVVSVNEALHWIEDSKPERKS